MQSKAKFKNSLSCFSYESRKPLKVTETKHAVHCKHHRVPGVKLHRPTMAILAMPALKAVCSVTPKDALVQGRMQLNPMKATFECSSSNIYSIKRGKALGWDRTKLGVSQTAWVGLGSTRVGFSPGWGQAAAPHLDIVHHAGPVDGARLPPPMVPWFGCHSSFDVTKLEPYTLNPKPGSLPRAMVPR